jgi:hypothetical protein
MGDDIDKAGREIVVAILQEAKPVFVLAAIGGVVGAYKLTQGAFEMLKSMCRTPEQHERLQAVQQAARPSATLMSGSQIQRDEHVQRRRDEDVL